MISTNVKIKKCYAMADTSDLNDWETNFIKDIYQKTKQGTDVSSLTERQVISLDRIHAKHFADE